MFQENIGEEVVADVLLSLETHYNSMGKSGHFSDRISFEIGYIITVNHICNDWTERFCEYDMDDQLDGSVCHLPDFNEECSCCHHSLKDLCIQTDGS